MQRILVIDDDEFVRNVIHRMLEQEGFEIFSASGGNEGLQLARQHRFDLVILDVVMPDKGGIETIVELRQLYPDQKAIVMSGRVPVEAESFRVLARQMGASIVIPKPFDRQTLVDAIKQALEER